MAHPAPSPASAYDQPHPSPHRARVGVWSLWFAILAAPAVWLLQLLINSSFAGIACYPHDVPLAQPAWPLLFSASSTVEIIALLVCAAGGLAGWRNWQHSRGESGDGRTRFMSIVGIMSSVLFLVGTAVAFAYVLTVPPCAG